MQLSPLEQAVEGFEQKSNKIIEKLNLLLSEVRPNGGSSLRDAVNRIEERQIRLDERSKAVLHESVDAIFESDSEGRMLWANHAYLRMVGRSMEEIRGFGWINSIHFDDREAVEDHWTQAVEQERPIDMKFRVVTPQGEITLVRAASYKMHSEKKGFVGFVVFFFRRYTLEAEEGEEVINEVPGDSLLSNRR